MNIMNKLTLRVLKENKRRTLITIIGVIISVAMLTAVSTITSSFLDTIRRQIIAYSGEWHVQYGGVKKDKLEYIVLDENTKAFFLSRPLGYALPRESPEEFSYFYLQQFNEEAFRYMQVKLVEGRLPKSGEEVVISKRLQSESGFDLKVGDTLSVQVGELLFDAPFFEGLIIDPGDFSNEIDLKNIGSFINTRPIDLKVVGIIETPKWEYLMSDGGYSVLSFLDEEKLASDDMLNVFVIGKKLTPSLYSDAEDLAEDLGIKEVFFNNDLLFFHGVAQYDNVNSFLFGIIGILITIIVIGSVALIYNAFAISVSERASHLGMLTSIGATKKQKRNSIFFEGAVIGLISIPLGVITGILGIWVTFYFINTYLPGALFGMTEKLRVVVTLKYLILSIAVSIFTIFISVCIPAIRASRISAIDAIRKVRDVKLTRKQVKTSKLVRKLFGFEAEIGLKNLKRNKRRYQVTVFSIVISIILFLTVSYFTENLKKSYDLSRLEDDSDLIIYPGYETATRTEARDAMDEIMKFDDVTEASLLFSTYISINTNVEQENLGRVYRDWYESQSKLGEESWFEMIGKELGYFNITLYGLEEESLKAYMKEAGIRADMSPTDAIPGIIVNVTRYYDYEENKYVEGKVFEGKVGDTLELQSVVWDEEKEEAVNSAIGTLYIAGLADTLPLGADFPYVPNQLSIIVSEESFFDLIEKSEDFNSYEYPYDFQLSLKSNNPDKTEEEIMNLNVDGLNVYNRAKQNENVKQLSIMISVFIYGFIGLITAISIANIFNTISTSVALRKREFAMLKSVGMTPKGFNKMIKYESIFYGIKALLYGLPISFLIMYWEYRIFQDSFEYGLEFPWKSILIVILSVFLIVGSSMLYSSAKIKKENIIDGMRQENI